MATEKTTGQKSSAAAPKGQDTDTAQKRREAYGVAQTRLRENHREEFVRLCKEEAEKRGISYNARKTPEEKAEADLARLLANNPSLAAKVQFRDGSEGEGQPEAAGA